MPIIYKDKKILEQYGLEHPALTVNKDHPCCKMERSAINDKSVFHWTREQSYQMYKYYCDGYKSNEIVDEFGESITDHTFREALKGSHYLNSDRTVSDETIEELWQAAEMEKKILESIGKEKEDG